MFIKQQIIEIKENNKIKILSPFLFKIGRLKGSFKATRDHDSIWAWLTLAEILRWTRTKKGEDYSRSSLLGFRNAIERYLNNPPFKRGIKIPGNPVFQISNKMLDAKIKMLKKEGKENITHKPAIAPEGLTKLKTSSVVLPSTPLGLLRNIWFHTTLYWCRRGREGQRSLTPQSFIFW